MELKTSMAGCAKTTNFISDAYHDYIIYKIERRDHIEY